MSNSNLVDNLRIWNIKINFSWAAPWPTTVLLQSNTEEKNKPKTTNEQQKWNTRIMLCLKSLAFTWHFKLRIKVCKTSFTLSDCDVANSMCTILLRNQQTTYFFAILLSNLQPKSLSRNGPWRILNYLDPLILVMQPMAISSKIFLIEKN